MLPSYLECSRDPAHRYSAAELATVCPHEGAPLLVRYEEELMPVGLCAQREWTMWRYREMLPIDTDEEPITLGEGATPLLRLPRLERELGIDELYEKPQSPFPTPDATPISLERPSRHQSTARGVQLYPLERTVS